MTHPATLTRNITSVYRAASLDQIADGIEWYDRAHRLAVELAATHDNDVSRAAGVIAALSPVTNWERNVEMARIVYATGGIIGGPGGMTTSANADRANLVYSGADWREVFGQNALKIRNFAQVIADPQDPFAVCVDRHASDVAFNVVSGKEAKALTPKGYTELADAYRRAARILTVSPAQVQAVTWVRWRESRIRCAASVRRMAGREVLAA